MARGAIISRSLLTHTHQAGNVWRYGPGMEEMTLDAEGLFGAARPAFGEGEFNHQSIYATTTIAKGRGGKIWRIHVGIEGATLYG